LGHPESRLVGTKDLLNRLICGFFICKQKQSRSWLFFFLLVIFKFHNSVILIIANLNYENMKKFISSISLMVLLAAGCGSQQTAQNSNAPQTASATPSTFQSSPTPPPTSAQLANPISNALSRITKKPFGIYVTPKTSPVQPEKFQGYHTGVDFETTPGEQNVDVPIFAACDGKLLMKKYATGYGGVAVQACKIDGADVTVIYGHVRLASVIPNAGDPLTAGKQIAVLGTGYSSETSGERKHLHFGIHKGAGINILGYVQVQSQLSSWLNAAAYLK
jgi:murein DD-endopeptidase MepM/ murein hydrolase activator NlpD